MSEALTRISEEEHSQERPLLSAVIYDSNKNMPGNGFFTMAKKLGKYNGSGDDFKKLEYFSIELKNVYEEWKK